MNGSLTVFRDSQSLVPRREGRIHLPPPHAVRIHTVHAGHIAPCNYQPALPLLKDL